MKIQYIPKKVIGVIIPNTPKPLGILFWKSIMYTLKRIIESTNPKKAPPAHNPWKILFGPARSRLNIPTKKYPTPPHIPIITADFSIMLPINGDLIVIFF